MGTSGHGGLKPGVDESNPWWSILKKVLANHGAGVKVEIFPVATDARFLRRYHRLAAGKITAMDAPTGHPFRPSTFHPCGTRPSFYTAMTNS
ncbi:unnamed protein product [Dibothriocephalus latus]|uniref:Uncharacterized protein n=1 Tax=Dibothriocephalus latus TaxID=60516 RepID=A0A3P7NVZ5_DIBLA|nr:unnamed protein product [Dibothriocephalus latus]